MFDDYQFDFKCVNKKLLFRIYDSKIRNKDITMFTRIKSLKFRAKVNETKVQVWSQVQEYKKN